MQLQEAGVLIEADSVRQANDLIGQGWKLLAVTANSGEDGCLYTCYVLGRRQKTEPEDAGIAAPIIGADPLAEIS